VAALQVVDFDLSSIGHEHCAPVRKGPNLAEPAGIQAAQRPAGRDVGQRSRDVKGRGKDRVPIRGEGRDCRRPCRIRHKGTRLGRRVHAPGLDPACGADRNGSSVGRDRGIEQVAACLTYRAERAKGLAIPQLHAPAHAGGQEGLAIA
jgi:hypothetical protein